VPSGRIRAATAYVLLEGEVVVTRKADGEGRELARLQHRTYEGLLDRPSVLASLRRTLAEQLTGNFRRLDRSLRDELALLTS